MNKISRSILLNWIPLLLYCLLIIFLSSNPGPGFLPRFKHADKMMHLAAFILLGILFFRAFWSTGIRINLFGMMGLSLVSSTIFGICIEVNQSFIPYRQAEGMDIAADIAGSALGIIMAWIFFRKRRRF